MTLVDAVGILEGAGLDDVERSALEMVLSRLEDLELAALRFEQGLRRAYPDSYKGEH